MGGIDILMVCEDIPGLFPYIGKRPGVILPDMVRQIGEHIDNERNDDKEHHAAGQCNDQILHEDLADML